LFQLIELNESLAESELQHMEIAEEFHKNVIQDNREQEDIYLSCRCELALYKKLADRFKASVCFTISFFFSWFCKFTKIYFS
jgi:hypothetical protein